MTFSEYIINERSVNFYKICLGDCIRFGITIEELLSNTYTEWNILYNSKDLQSTNNMEYMTAAEAKKISEEIKDTSNHAILESIENSIKLDSSEGNSQTFIYVELSTSVFNHLRTRGFVIDNLSSQREGIIYKISWE